MMKISERTIEKLARIIIGDNEKVRPYRNSEALVKFFNNFGFDDIYHKGLPPRLDYTKERLNKLNGGEHMAKIIEKEIDPLNYKIGSLDSNEAAVALNKYLIKDGYKIVEGTRTHSNLSLIMILAINIALLKGDISKYPNNYFEKCFKVKSLGKKAVAIIDIESKVSLSHDFVAEQIQKSQQKIEQGDYDGAITNARSLVESFQEELIRKAGVEVPDYAGDIGKLYKTTKKVLNLDPSQKDLSENLKQMLSSLNGLVMGIGGLSNKMGDRHARTYKPEIHHAKLAVNSAFIFCEFLLDSYEYQQDKKNP